MTRQTELRYGAVTSATGRGAQPVRLTRAADAGAPRVDDPRLAQILTEAVKVRGDAQRAISLAGQLGDTAPLIGGGATVTLWETLASLGAIDLTAARVAEAHLDALGILQQAGVRPAELFPTAGTVLVWGVFAAETTGMQLDAVPETSERWRLDGIKPWCSLAGSLSHALVTARTSDTERRLFAVDLRQSGVGVHQGGWVALGLPSVPSGPVDFSAVEAQPIGDDEWYLRRPGFAWGGIGVAACWYGGAVGVARQLYRAVRTPANDAADQIALAHLGAIDVLLSACAAALADAAVTIDSGAAFGVNGQRLAARVRGLVARSSEEVLVRVGHALGPSPLAFDARHAQRVADLTLYVRQHHAERDDAALARLLLHSPAQSAVAADAGAPW